MAYSAPMVIEMLHPTVSVTAIPSHLILTRAQQNAMKLNTTTAFANVTFSPKMHTEIGAYIISLLVPGHVNFLINFDDIPSDDHGMLFLTAIAAKMLLCYSETPRFNGIVPASVREVERIIVMTCSDANILRVAMPPDPWPLNGCAATPDGHFRELPGLQTTAFGGGWRESGRELLADIDINEPYFNCQRRPFYVTTVDDVTQIEGEQAMADYANWGTFNAISALLHSFARHAGHSSPLRGIDGVFQLLARNIFEFFVSVNDYNRKHWYTALRLSEEGMRNLYQARNEDACVMQISGKTLLYLMKCLSKETIENRRNPYESQFKAECGLMRDCVIALHRSEIWERFLNEFQVPAGIYSARERLERLTPKAGPLNKVLDHIGKVQFARDVAEFYRCADGQDMLEVYRRPSDLVFRNLIQFGVSREMLLRPV